MNCDTCIREWRHLLTGPVYEVPLHLVQSSQKPVPGLRFVPSIAIYFELIMLDTSFGRAKLLLFLTNQTEANSLAAVDTGA